MKKFNVAALLFSLCVAARGGEPAKIDWQPWSNSIFEKARKEDRFVLLDLGAVWCHWCHVMEGVTYRDPKVIALIRAQCQIPMCNIQRSRRWPGSSARIAGAQHRFVIRRKYRCSR